MERQAFINVVGQIVSFGFSSIDLRNKANQTCSQFNELLFEVLHSSVDDLLLGQEVS